MRLITRLKSLGLDLKRIKEILGGTQDVRSLKEVLLSLRVELINEKESIEERVTKIDGLLSEEKVNLSEETFESPMFQRITDIIGEDQIEKYLQVCPEIYVQQRNLFGIFEDLQWGEGFEDTFRVMAEYFKQDPEQYQIALDFGRRLAKLAQLSEAAPEIEELAQEAAEFIKSVPFLKMKLFNQTGLKEPLDNLLDSIVGKFLSPAQMKHKQLLQKYLNYKTE
jgi:DNA-binding transcriptional MerR regulator